MSYKVFDLRIPEITETPVYKYDFCTCGHSWLDHTAEKPKKYRNLRHWLVSRILIWCGPCETCQCPAYEHMGKFSYEEMSQMKEDNMLNGDHE